MATLDSENLSSLSSSEFFNFFIVRNAVTRNKRFLKRAFLPECIVETQV